VTTTVGLTTDRQNTDQCNVVQLTKQPFMSDRHKSFRN